MKIAIVKNNYKNTQHAVAKIKKHLIKKHTITNTNPDMVIAIGGDGTFLTAIQKFWLKNPTATFFAIHSGTLGFYSDYTCEEIDIFLKAFDNKDFEIQKADLLKSEFNKNIYYALNDFRIESERNKTAVIDVDINNTHFESFRGNGLCFSTQTGSTGYNKSLGGAIMWPSTSGFQMTEVAPISNNAYSSINSSIIFSHKDKISLKVTFDNAFLSNDTNSRSIKNNQNIKISLITKKVKIARFTKHYNFFKRLQDGFIK